MTRLLEPSRPKFTSSTSPCLLLAAAVVDTVWLTRSVMVAHRIACDVGQLRQDIHDKIVASGGSRVFFASKHMIALRIKEKVLAQAQHLSHSMRLKHQDRRAHGSAEEAHPQVQTEASDRSLSRHVSHLRKSLKEVSFSTCKICDPSPCCLPRRTYLRDPQCLPKESNKTSP